MNKRLRRQCIFISCSRAFLFLLLFFHVSLCLFKGSSYSFRSFIFYGEIALRPSSCTTARAAVGGEAWDPPDPGPRDAGDATALQLKHVEPVPQPPAQQRTPLLSLLSGRLSSSKTPPWPSSRLSRSVSDALASRGPFVGAAFEPELAP